MKGDRVEIVIDAGGSSRSYEIEAGRVLALVEHPATRRPPRDSEPVTALRPTA